MFGKLVVSAFLLFAWTSSSAQNLLQELLSVNLVDVPAQQALDLISGQAGCRFSFNPDVLPEKNITASFADQPLETVLEKTLGKNYLFKVRGSYIIIQPAQEKPSHRANIEFTGEVVDATTGRSLSNTSVYEVNNLSTTLSGDDGTYKLSTFFQDGVTAFAISKEHYRDTIIRITNPQIAPIKIELEPLDRAALSNERSFRQFVDSLNIVRYLVNKKARETIRNVDMVEERWLQVSLLPVVGTNGLMGGKIGNKVSLNLFAGYGHSVNGVELGGFFNVDRMDVAGVQASGFGNIVGGEVKGVQLSGFVNLTPGGGKGTQLSGFVNHAGTRYSGVQATGFVNVANNIKGAQLATFTNFTLLDMQGVQMSAFVNMAGNASGLQSSAFVNMAKEMRGVQVAAFVNMASTVNGLQIGFINVAKKVEHGATIGILNFVKEGVHSFDIGTNDITDINLGFRSGTKHFYTLLSFGVSAYEADGVWSMGIGAGTKVNWTDKIYTDFELSTNTVQPIDTWVGNSSDDRRIQINFGFRLLKWASINAGPVLHFYKYSTTDASPDLSGRFEGSPLFKSSGSSNSSKVWVGYSASLRLF